MNATSHSPTNTCEYDYYLEKAAVINQLNTDYNTIENANNIFNRVCVYDEKRKWMKTKYNWGGGGWSIIHECFDERGTPLHDDRYYYVFSTIFGRYAFGGEDRNLQYYTKGRRFNEAIEKEGRCGIEVLGMKPKRTKDGKYTYEGFTIKELKERCKMNKIKGYSKMDKCELVSLLMKI
jgi:hypothetical protein